MYHLAIYGGTFAPVHIGHIRAANAFYNTVKPDKLLIIPTLIPPHKQLCSHDAPEKRLKMLELAFGDHPLYNKKLFISDIELNSPPPSYTVNTLNHFHNENTHISFLCGTDMFLTLHKWYMPQKLFSMCSIVCMLRECDRSSTCAVNEQASFLKNTFNADIIFIDEQPIEISSSQIRNGDDETRKKYLPEKVYQYITENKLYENN